MGDVIVDKDLGLDKFNRQITLNSDGVTDVYTIDGVLKLEYKSGTPIDFVLNAINSMPVEGDVEKLDAPSAIDKKISEFSFAKDGFESQHYPPDVKLNLLTLHYLATQQGRANQAGYIAKYFDWLTSLLKYNFTFIQKVSVLTDYKEIAALEFDFDANTMPDPLITVFQASQILD